MTCQSKTRGKDLRVAARPSEDVSPTWRSRGLRSAREKAVALLVASGGAQPSGKARFLLRVKRWKLHSEKTFSAREGIWLVADHDEVEEFQELRIRGRWGHVMGGTEPYGNENAVGVWDFLWNRHDLWERLCWNWPQRVSKADHSAAAVRLGWERVLPGARRALGSSLLPLVVAWRPGEKCPQVLSTHGWPDHSTDSLTKEGPPSEMIDFPGSS